MSKYIYCIICICIFEYPQRLTGSDKLDAKPPLVNRCADGEHESRNWFDVSSRRRRSGVGNSLFKRPGTCDNTIIIIIMFKTTSVRHRQNNQITAVKRVLNIIL